MASHDRNDPAWKYVAVALTKAGDLARGKGYRWKGESCFLVSALALQLVIKTRNEERTSSGKLLIPTDNPKDINLAYADHYLHMRAEAARSGPGSAGLLKAKVKGYDALKRVVLGMKGLPDGPDAKPLDGFYKWVGTIAEQYLREGKQPLSPPDRLSIYWANEGIKDGFSDFRNNPGIDNDPKQLSF